MTGNNRWTCKLCHTPFSQNYKYKNHLSRCLVYQYNGMWKQHVVRIER